MRQRILTPREPEYIQIWLFSEKTKRKLHEMLRYHSKEFLPELTEEIELTKRFLYAG
jgi:hypothetical protein